MESAEGEVGRATKEEQNFCLNLIHTIYSHDTHRKVLLPKKQWDGWKKSLKIPKERYNVANTHAQAPHPPDSPHIFKSSEILSREISN